MELSAKKTVVIGASRGIGKAIAVKFAQEGADVIITARNEKSLCDTADAVRAVGRNVFPIAWDVSHCAEADRKVEECAQIMGRIDICVCSAGIVERTPPLSVTEEGWDAVMNINLKGIYFVCQAMARHMLNRNKGFPKGKIINLASETGTQPYPTPYGISKWGVVGFTMGMARCLFKKGIVLSAIAPGPVTTEMMMWQPGQSDAYPSSFGRMASPEEIADLAVFLASHKGDRIAGRPVFINGGLDW